MPALPHGGYYYDRIASHSHSHGMDWRTTRYTGLEFDVRKLVEEFALRNCLRVNLDDIRYDVANKCFHFGDLDTGDSFVIHRDMMITKAARNNLSLKEVGVITAEEARKQALEKRNMIVI